MRTKIKCLRKRCDDIVNCNLVSMSSLRKYMYSIGHVHVSIIHSFIFLRHTIFFYSAYCLPRAIAIYFNITTHLFRWKVSNVCNTKTRIHLLFKKKRNWSRSWHCCNNLTFGKGATKMKRTIYLTDIRMDPLNISQSIHSNTKWYRFVGDSKKVFHFNFEF